MTGREGISDSPFTQIFEQPQFSLCEESSDFNMALPTLFPLMCVRYNYRDFEFILYCQCLAAISYNQHAYESWEESVRTDVHTSWLLENVKFVKNDTVYRLEKRGKVYGVTFSYCLKRCDLSLCELHGLKQLFRELCETMEINYRFIQAIIECILVSDLRHYKNKNANISGFYSRVVVTGV